MTRYTVHFTGRVQGVGFRYATTRLARDYSVAGYVQNLADGRVRLVVEGRKDELDSFVESVQERMARNIRNTHIDEQAATGEFGDPTPGNVQVKH